MIYFTSDLHLGHSKIVEFERLKFKTIEEHDNDIYQKIAKLQSSDILYILGDIGKIDPVKWHKYNIKCKIFLLKGNHDTYPNYYYIRFGINVIDFPFYFNHRVFLSHFPHKVDDDILNIHGHLHCSNLDLNNYYNVNYYLNNCNFLKIKDIEIFLTNLKQDKNKNKYGYEWWINNQIILPEYREMKKDECDENGCLNVDYIRRIHEK